VQLQSLSVSFFILGVFYFVLFLISVFQLVRITRFSEVPLSKFSTQKSFFTLLCSTAIFRTFFFFIVPLATTGDFGISKFDNPYLTILDDFGCLVFFSSFSLLILFWAEIIYHARNKRLIYSSKVKPAFHLLIFLIYALQIAIWVLLSTIARSYFHYVDVIDHCYYSFISLIAFAGFVYFGGKLYIMLQRNPIESAGRKNKMREVLLVTAICAFCFIARAIAFLVITLDTPLETNMYSVIIFYTIAEVVPAILVLFILRKLPPRQVSVNAQTSADNSRSSLLGRNVT